MIDDNIDLCSCGKHRFEDNKDYYMLTDELWLKINGQEDGMLCMDCVEKKLGRKLEAGDIKPCFLTLFKNKYTKDIMVKSGYKLTLEDLYNFMSNVFNDQLSTIFQFYHTKKLYKFFQELSVALETCRQMIEDVDGYKTNEHCLCAECIFEEIIYFNLKYGYQRTINGKN